MLEFIMINLQIEPKLVFGTDNNFALIDILDLPRIFQMNFSKL